MPGEMKINCPKCGFQFALSDAITSQYRKDLESEMTPEIEESMRKEFRKELETMQTDLRAKTEKEISEKIGANFEMQLKDLAIQLEEKDLKLNEAYRNELILRSKAREIEEKEKNLELELARKIDSEKEKFFENQRLKDMEKDEKISMLIKQIDELKRKAEQGSMQAQGEALELDFEQVLRQKFPSDEIIEVPKGVEGGDIIQKVYNMNNYCGTIIWEMKNTKNWSEKWIDKLKQDQREKKADAAVIVSRTIPQCISNCADIDGIWVSNYKFAAEFSDILRANIVSVSNARSALEGREEKMEAVYNYLSSNSFRQRVDAIVEAFISMRSELEREKTAMQKIWAARQVQIDRIVKNTAGMYGDIQGIIGASLPEIENLEIDGNGENDRKIKIENRFLELED